MRTPETLRIAGRCDFRLLNVSVALLLNRARARSGIAAPTEYASVMKMTVRPTLCEATTVEMAPSTGPAQGTKTSPHPTPRITPLERLF